MNEFSRVFPSVPVRLTEQLLVSHAGTKVITEFVNALGFRRLCEDRLGQFTPAGATHRPGTLIGQLALMLAAGGEHVSDLDMFRNQDGVFGQVASNATVSRFFERATADPEVFSHGFETLTRSLRSMVWDAAGDRSPAARASQDTPVLIDLDATLVTAHSEKEETAGNYKRGYGFAPFVASVDYGSENGTGEILAAMMRPGNATANNADDHIRLFESALAQLPEAFYTPDGKLIGQKILIRTDSAGSSRKFLWHLHHTGVQYSVSYQIPPGRAHMVDWIGNKDYWQPALDQAGTDRADAWVINATDVIPLTGYPPGTNLFLRAEPLHPGAKPTLLDEDGHRITAFLTNSPRWHGPTLDIRHRARARCENRIKTLKNTGLGKLPFFAAGANQAWAHIAALASNLFSWLQLAAVPTGHGARFWDAKRFRYRLFAIAGKLTRHGRATHLLLPKNTPESGLVTAILANIQNLLQRCWKPAAIPI